MRKVAFEIRDNSIQASLSYAGPSVHNMVYILSVRPVNYHSEADHAAGLAGKRMKQSNCNWKIIGVPGNQV